MRVPQFEHDIKSRGKKKISSRQKKISIMTAIHDAIQDLSKNGHAVNVRPVLIERQRSTAPVEHFRGCIKHLCSRAFTEHPFRCQTGVKPVSLLSLKASIFHKMYIKAIVHLK